MKTRNIKGATALIFIASLLCIVSLTWTLARNYIFYNNEITWHEELYPLQVTIFCSKVFFKSAFYLLLVIFLVKQYKALKSGLLFLRSNTKLLYTISATYLIGSIAESNIPTMVTPQGDTANLIINTDTLIYTALLVMFAILYKIAADVSEENNLTI